MAKRNGDNTSHNDGNRKNNRKRKRTGDGAKGNVDGMRDDRRAKDNAGNDANNEPLIPHATWKDRHKRPAQMAKVLKEKRLAALRREKSRRKKQAKKQRKEAQEKRSEIRAAVAPWLDNDIPAEPNDKFMGSLWNCDTIEAVDKLFQRWWETFRNKAYKALDRRKIEEGSKQTVRALLYEPGATSRPVLSSEDTCTKAYHTLRDRLILMVKSDPLLQIGLLTIIDGRGETSHTKTEVELFHSHARAASVLRAIAPDFFGVTELSLFNSHGHPDGGQRVQRHEHALVIGKDIQAKAAQVTRKHSKKFLANFTGADVINVKMVAIDDVNIARMAAYLFKPPHQCSNWCPPREGKKGHMNHSEKGDRKIRYLRLAQLRTMMAVEDVTFGGGEGHAIRSSMIKLLRALAAERATGGRMVLHPDAIPSFWNDLSSDIGAIWNLPIIKTAK